VFIDALQLAIENRKAFTRTGTARHSISIDEVSLRD
jgi:hypothetical protein